MEAAARQPSAPERAFARWTPFIVWTPYAGLGAALLWSWRYGVQPVHLWTCAVGYLVTLAGVEAGFHRHFAHQAFKASPWVRFGLGVAGSMAAQGPLIYWLSNHIRHHALADRPGDPHSPNLHGPGAAAGLRGFLHAHTGWILHVDLAESYRYMPTSCVKDRVVKIVNRYFLVWMFLGLMLPTAVCGLWLGSWSGALGGLLWGGLVRILLVNQAVFLVNSVCHLYGDRPFPGKDSSTNVGWLSLFTLGGSYHNNHHAAPASPRTSEHWWQPDPSYWLIATLEVLGLAWELKQPRRKPAAATE